MKQKLLLFTGLFISVLIYGQSKINFYVANGTKEVSRIKCGEFDNIKIKFKLPANVKDFDLVKLKVFPSSINNAASIIYDGKGSISTLAANQNYEKWILKPGKKDGDFNFYGSGNLGMQDLCEYPHEKGMKQIELEIQLAGYNKTGTETYWDKWDKAYKTRNTYSEGSLLAKGKLIIEQLPPQNIYVSKNGLISIPKVTNDFSHEAIRGDKKSSSNEKKNQFNSFMNSANSGEGEYELFSATLLPLSGKGYADVSFVMYKNTNVAQKAGVDASEAYDLLKKDLLQRIARNSYNKIYKEPTFNWPEMLQHQFCPDISDATKNQAKKKKSFMSGMIANSNSSAANKIITNDSYWHKEKVGNYEYDVLRIPNTYGGSSYYHFDADNKTWFSTKDENDAPAELVIYAIQRGDYSIFIIPTYTDRNNENIFLKDKDPEKAAAEKAFVEKTMAAIQFN